MSKSIAPVVKLQSPEDVQALNVKFHKVTDGLDVNGNPAVLLWIKLPSKQSIRLALSVEDAKKLVGNAFLILDNLDPDWSAGRETVSV